MKQIYTHSKNIVSRKIAGEVILVPIRTRIADMNYLYTLNPTAARIWQLLDGQTSLEAVSAAICQDFAIDPQTARTDLEEVIQELLRIEAITEVPQD